MGGEQDLGCRPWLLVSARDVWRRGPWLPLSPLNFGTHRLSCALWFCKSRATPCLCDCRGLAPRLSPGSPIIIQHCCSQVQLLRTASTGPWAMLVSSPVLFPLEERASSGLFWGPECAGGLISAFCSIVSLFHFNNLLRQNAHNTKSSLLKQRVQWHFSSFTMLYNLHPYPMLQNISVTSK